MALHVKLDRMKNECDKLAAQLGAREEAHSLLHRKYQQLKLELEDEVSQKSFATFSCCNDCHYQAEYKCRCFVAVPSCLC